VARRGIDCAMPSSFCSVCMLVEIADVLSYNGYCSLDRGLFDQLVDDNHLERYVRLLLSIIILRKLE
jgi:hypothetical protein